MKLCALANQPVHLFYCLCFVGVFFFFSFFFFSIKHRFCFCACQIYFVFSVVRIIHVSQYKEVQLLMICTVLFDSFPPLFGPCFSLLMIHHIRLDKLFLYIETLFILSFLGQYSNLNQSQRLVLTFKMKSKVHIISICTYTYQLLI